MGVETPAGIVSALSQLFPSLGVVIAHNQFTLCLGAVSLKQIYTQVEQKLCDTLPWAFSVFEMEARVEDVLSELVREGHLGY